MSSTDELLERLRKSASLFQDSSAQDDNAAELAGELATAFQELDTELVNGGDLPQDWSPAR